MSKIRTGVKAGIALVVVGVITGIFNHFALEIWNYTLNILIGFPIFFFWGLSLIIFPGPEIYHPLKTEDINGFWRNSPVIHRIGWIFGIALGAAGTVFAMFYYNIQP
jgi:hypothetical protein